MIAWFASLSWYGLYLFLPGVVASQVLQWTLIIHAGRRLRQISRPRRWPFRLTIALSCVVIALSFGAFALWFIGFWLPEFTAAVESSARG